MTTRRRRTRTERQAETRAELVAAAARVFARRGYDAASVAAIADEAGYSHGAVYSNFEGKRDLFLALYEFWVAQRVQEIEVTFESDGDVRERTQAAADDWLRRLAEDPEPFLLRLEFTIRAARDPDLRKALALRVGAIPLAIRRLLEDGAEGQELDLPLPADELARGLQALSLGLALEALSNPDAIRPGLAGDLAGLLVRGRAESKAR